MVSDNTRIQIEKGVVEAATAYSKDVPISSLGIRVVMWGNVLQMIKDKPLLGSGSGSFRHDYSHRVKDIAGWRGRVSDDPHQQYLHIAAEYGLVGLFLFLIAISSWFFSHYDFRCPYQMAAIAFLIGTMANAFANGHFSAFVEGRFVWIFLATGLSGTQLKKFQGILGKIHVRQG